MVVTCVCVCMWEVFNPPALEGSRRVDPQSLRTKIPLLLRSGEGFSPPHTPPQPLGWLGFRPVVGTLFEF